jgi:hypothetical protein
LLLTIVLTITRALERWATDAYISALAAAHREAAYGERSQQAAVERANNAIAEAREYAALQRQALSSARSFAKNVLVAANVEADRVRTGASI